MNPGKIGRIFTILMIALIAYGSASAIILFAEIPRIEMPQIIKAPEEKMNIIGDPTFQPVWLQKRAIRVNNTTIQNETNQTNQTNRSRQ
ncbi:hypothetical protein [Methanothermobacter tenebrarum]|uniref:Uncharacterized protein n=1 Tax=Methanothermobacter tenebrarum TaxID=680118 RepID=A0A328PHD8_9EURY|nr:hypothetical protein [Methanothermobacter tenebrarum]MBC7100363.1 hypothetical protein [Methanobacteriales archaeon]MBC7117908.1 hypothetical protein [Methanobacteriaceae archaeon]NPV64378.1 hypothetical protein [Methanobacteriaceae archaeon]RAO78844.1 hypothetical protein DPC56_06200 [Methanothermobacter tenebrarum]